MVTNNGWKDSCRDAIVVVVASGKSSSTHSGAIVNYYSHYVVWVTSSGRSLRTSCPHSAEITCGRCFRRRVIAQDLNSKRTIVFVTIRFLTDAHHSRCKICMMSSVF